MTREEVKAQLAKSPLEWTRSKDPIAEAGVMHNEVRIFYIVTDGDVLIKADDCEICAVGEYLGYKGEDVEALKSKAEAHRLDFICRMLGVTE
mgnify:CR=1 FL=1